MRYALQCIACGRELKNVDDDSVNQPYCGTAFISHGHYGSTAFDPMDGHYLEINVCDLCLIQHRNRIYEGRDFRPVVEDGSVVDMESIKPPYKLVRWRVDSEKLEWVIEQTRKEFELVEDDPVE